LVVCDDINLPLGKLRVRGRGTHGGHNGLKDIQQHLGTTQYPRLRIGVEAPLTGDAVDHVLGRFRPAEWDVIDDAISRAVQAVGVWIHQGIDVCMNQYNG
jgi:PTH1 family peptidyl-tRNA hydrolase